MKRLVCGIALAALITGMAWGADYPNPTMEQVAFTPGSYLGKTVLFDKGRFQPKVYKETKFGDVRYGILVMSRDSSAYYSTFDDDQITFYATESLASKILFSGLPVEFTDANLLCIVEKTERTEYSKNVTYWLCRIIKIEVLDDAGNVTTTMIDDGVRTVPENPVITMTRTVTALDNPGWVKLSGTVKTGDTPLCAMVLANGQYMFSCAGAGEYSLEVPLDSNGNITLFGFCDGMIPLKQIFKP